MTNKIKIITAPDVIFDQATTILAVCPDEDLKKNLETYVSTAESNLNIYLYEGHEQEIQWLLTIAKMADIILLDIDNASEDVTHFLSYIISIPTTYYRCNHKNVPWDLLNQNRFFDFPKLNED